MGEERMEKKDSTTRQTNKQTARQQNDKRIKIEIRATSLSSDFVVILSVVF